MSPEEIILKLQKADMLADMILQWQDETVNVPKKATTSSESFIEWVSKSATEYEEAETIVYQFRCLDLNAFGSTGWEICDKARFDYVKALIAGGYFYQVRELVVKEC
tara:strand:- start:1060 stop:1380 length:321 start_codon:yes stop_codon:yes gene_type:complete